jgi:hypothetical protein
VTKACWTGAILNAVKIKRIKGGKSLEQHHTNMAETDTGVSCVAAKQYRVCGVPAEGGEEAKTSFEDKYQGGE